MDATFLIRYRHIECGVNPDVEWFDSWTCACNGKCPACGVDDIEPMDWKVVDDGKVREASAYAELLE